MDLPYFILGPIIFATISILIYIIYKLIQYRSFSYTIKSIINELKFSVTDLSHEGNKIEPLENYVVLLSSLIIPLIFGYILQQNPFIFNIIVTHLFLYIFFILVLLSIIAYNYI